MNPSSLRAMGLIDKFGDEERRCVRCDASALLGLVRCSGIACSHDGQEHMPPLLLPACPTVGA